MKVKTVRAAKPTKSPRYQQQPEATSSVPLQGKLEPPLADSSGVSQPPLATYNKAESRYYVTGELKHKKASLPPEEIMGQISRVIL